MKNDLFNQTLMRKYSKNFKLTPSKHDLILKHIKKLDEGQFEAETKNYIYFYEVWLKGILDYDLDENVLIEEKEEQGRGKSEFILKSGDKKFMVVELKDQKTDLDKPQNRVNDKRTPVDQAFDYAQHTGDIDWILVSNYNEFRLYNWHKKGQYISFKAEELLDKTLFSYFMLSFSKMSYIDTGYIDKLMDKTVVIERELEKEFYKLYNETRLMLIKEFEEFNNFNRLEAIHYAQMIMNRYMFICFAEDIDLLPAQVSTDTILTPILKGNLRHGSIWQRLNELFLDINEGNEYKKISQYNGGIFKEDLDHLKIRDIVEDQKFFDDVYQNWKFEEYEKDINTNLGPYGQKVNPIYRNLLTISTFDFSSELDVNILGHIFENSIGDIEELKEGSKGRRKKEGIFYTPEYITDYICKNTIIPFLSKSGQANTTSNLIGEYWGSAINELDQKVKDIKVVDPACGSGAFLNKAADILLEIHHRIHEVRYKDKKETLIPYFDNIGQRREILLNNIYGVDLNEESVDITKLSLFLKVCRKGLILPNLDKNIKCGNSLVDDTNFTDKPFKWEEEFKDIFNDGGFDIVIGNPPYVRQEKIKEIKPYLKDHYEVYTGVADLFVYFFEKGMNILKNGGYFSFISSNKFTRANYGDKLRKFILKYEFIKYVDYTESNVFLDAKIDPCITIIRNKTYSAENMLIINDEYAILQNNLDENSWNFEKPDVINLKNKIFRNGTQIKDIKDIKIYRGILTGFNEAFIINENIKNELIDIDKKNLDIIKPILGGRDIQKWEIKYNHKYLLYIPWKFPINDFPAIKNHLLKFEASLKKRPEVKSGRVDWFALSRYASDYYHEFEKEKLVFPYIKKVLFTVFDDNKYYILDTGAFITSKTLDIKFLGVLLSSKTLDFVFKMIGSPLSRTGAVNEIPRYKLNKASVEKIPIYLATPEEQKPFIEEVNGMLELNKTLQNEINSFKEWLKYSFNIGKPSQKLEKYYELSFDDFLNEVKKKKVNVKSRDNYQTLKEEFEKSITIINPLLQKIHETDNEIDQMVYDLYGLTPEEIQIIEESLD